MRRRLVPSFLVMLAAVFLAAACGGGTISGTPRGEAAGLENKSPAQVLQAAVHELKHAGSVHYTGIGTPVGLPGRVDFRIQGASFAGKLTAPGARVDITHVGDIMYFKADEAGWRVLGAAEEMAPFAGIWIKTTVSEEMWPAPSIASLAGQLSKFKGDLVPGVRQSTLDGTDVVEITTTNGDTLYVANTGDARPLRLVSQGVGSADLSEHGAAFHITAPLNAVDMDP